MCINDTRRWRKGLVTCFIQSRAFGFKNSSTHYVFKETSSKFGKLKSLRRLIRGPKDPIFKFASCQVDTSIYDAKCPVS